MFTLSVVIPIFNEKDNILLLIEEIKEALSDQVTYEIIVVDDASKDGSHDVVLAYARSDSRVKLISHARNRGQSAAVVTGVRQAQYPWVATLDGDRQNDPKDLLHLIETVGRSGQQTLLCMGQRIKREDHWVRKASTKIANRVRRFFLRDQCHDSGCGIKIFSRDTFLRLPLFRNCHRFMPALFARAGAVIIYVPVNHRPRVAGKSKYGVFNRLFVGIVDLMGVAWLLRRFIEIEAETRA